MKQKLNPKPVVMLFLLLMMIFLMPTPAQAEPSITDITAFLPASKEHYTRTEVANLILEIWIIAEEEMETTALEAAKEAAADEAGEKAVIEAINLELQNEAACLLDENRKLDREKNLLKTFFMIAGGVAIGTTAMTILTLIIN